MLFYVKTYLPSIALFLVFMGIPFDVNLSALSSGLILNNLNYSNKKLKYLRSQIFHNLEISKNRKSEKRAYPLRFYKYKVKDKDNFFTIMSKTGQNADTLVNVNNLASVYDIRRGQVLKIPNYRGIFYNRKKKDTIEKISKDFSISIAALSAANYGKSFIKKGLLFLPGVNLSKEERSYYSLHAFIHPLPQARVSSPYGFRINPFTKRRTFHTGIDLAAPWGTKIKAASNGRVVWAGRKGGYGNLIILRHAKGYYSYYGHLSKILVAKGDRVKRGQFIGRVGSTGLSTGPHLHFEIRKMGKTQSPLKVIHRN